ncbi:hypothetical protein ACOPJQ_08625 [Luteimonas dalianensis]|uniref:hypothetical protein n=1 Tax=Luteimonas dalianensis TaxID=1148196 RepID=UPI003BF2A65D
MPRSTFKTIRTCAIYLALLVFLSSMFDAILFNANKMSNAANSIRATAHAGTPIQLNMPDWLER